MKECILRGNERKDEIEHGIQADEEGIQRKKKEREKICRVELELKIAEIKLRIDDIKFMVSDIQDNVSINLWDELDDVQIMAKKEKVYNTNTQYIELRKKVRKIK